MTNEAIQAGLKDMAEGRVTAFSFLRFCKPDVRKYRGPRWRSVIKRPSIAKYHINEALKLRLAHIKHKPCLWSHS